MAVEGATPVSSVLPYAQPSDLTDLRDWRWLGDRLYDNDTRPSTKGTVESDPLITRALRFASSYIESAATKGGRYSPADLMEMTEVQIIPADQGGNGILTAYMVAKELIIKLTCDIAVWWLCCRRPSGIKPENVSGVKEALEDLERLRLGEHIFPIGTTQQAGLPDAVSTDRETDIVRASAPITQAAGRFFKTRVF